MALAIHTRGQRAKAKIAEEVLRHAEDVPRSAWVVLCLGTAAVFADMYSTQAILPRLGSAFDQPPAVTGLTVSVLVLAVAFGALVAGPLSDHLGRKPVMVGASSLLVIPTLLCALAPNFAILLLARTAQGLLMPGLTSVAVVYIAELFPEAQRGRAMGVYVGGQVLGGLLARGISAGLTAWIDWRGALISFAALTALGALAIARYLPQSPGTMRAERSSLVAGLRLHLSNGRLLGLCAIGLSMFFAFVGIFTYLPYYLTGAPWHFPVGTMGLIYLVWLTGLCSPLAGSLAARYTARRVILFSLSCSCLGIALLSLQLLPVLVLGLLILTLGQFTAMPGVNLMVSEAGSSARGAAYALYLCCYYLGGSAGAVLPGILFTHLGWSGVLAGCGASAVLALIIAQRARIT